jgi:hypothetical protein
MSLVGRLEDLALSDIFQILSIGKKTGTLILQGSRGNALIVFKNGLVVRAETSDLERTLGEDLLHSGVIKDTMLNLASEVKKKLPLKSVPEILHELGSVSKEALEKITKKRVERVVYQLLVWQDGDFQFEPDDIDPRGKADLSDIGWELSKGMSPEYLLMEGARVHDESSQVATVSTGEIFGIQDEGEKWEEEWSMQPPQERKDISSLRALTQELRFPNTSSEITLLILRFASDMFSRGVLFMVGDTEIVGLGQFGLEIEQPDEKIRGILLSFKKSPFLKNVLSEKRPYKGSMAKDEVTGSFVDSIGGQWADEVALFPIVAESKVVALLFCDNLTTGESLGESEGLEIFIDQAGLALEKSLLQRRIQEMEKRSKN